LIFLEELSGQFVVVLPLKRIIVPQWRRGFPRLRQLVKCKINLLSRSKNIFTPLKPSLSNPPKLAEKLVGIQSLERPVIFSCNKN